MARSSKAKKRPAGGAIDTLPSGALRVRVDGGLDPVTKRRYRPTQVIPAGPDAEQRANDALIRMLNEVNERRHPKTHATMNQLLDKHLETLHAAERTKRTYRQYIDTHIRPLIGEQKTGRLDAHILDSFYAELLRCRTHCRNKHYIEHRTPANMSATNAVAPTGARH